MLYKSFLTVITGSRCAAGTAIDAKNGALIPSNIEGQ
jgi:hypothetical protein